MKESNRNITIVLDEKLVASQIMTDISKLKDILEREGDHKDVIVNMERVKYIDSMGITFLIGMYKQLSIKEKSLKLINVSSEIRSLFSIMKLDTVFNC